MDNNNNPNSYTLSWKYRLYYPNKSQAKNESEYIETVTGKEKGEESHSGFGYIAMFEYAKRVIKNDRDNLQTIPDEIIGEEIINTYCTKNGYGKYYLVSLMFAIAADGIKKLAIDLLSGDEERYSQARDTISSKFNFQGDNFQDFFDRETEAINHSFFDYQDNKPDIPWEKVFDTIHKTIENGENQELNSFLNGYLVNKNLVGDCVGIYIFDNEEESLLTFSGFNDVGAINKEKTAFARKNDDFSNAIGVLCNSIPAKLVTSSMNICKYKVDETEHFEVECSLGEVLKTREFDCATKKEFSCCERKIFTEFKEKNGILHTTFYPCERCKLGILYYKQEGVDIKCKWDIKKRKAARKNLVCLKEKKK